MARWTAFRQTKQNGTVASQLDHHRLKKIKENRQYLQQILKIALLCACQNIALRGHDESEDSNNKGNFLEILSLLKSESNTFRSRYDNAPLNAKYTSKEIQNDLLDAAAKVVLNTICDEVRSAPYFALIADECKDIARTEQLSICIRFVSEYENVFVVKERFMGFVDVHQLDASSLANAILSLLNELHLDTMRCVSQCYDGASVMSGHLAGVQAIVKQSIGHECVYIHCYAHRLNLVVVSIARGIVEVNDFFGLLEAMYRFFSVSTLRHDVFINVQKRKSKQVLEIPQLSDTRWVCRYIAVRLFQTRYEDILEALDSISKGTDRSTAAESFGLAFQLRRFSFTVLLCVFEELLGLTKPLSDHLQATEISLCHAIDLVQAVVKTLESNRSDIHFSDSIWKKALVLASERNIELDSAIHRQSRQPSRLTDSIVCETTGSRADSPSLEAKYRRIYFDVMDKVLVELHNRFDVTSPILRGIASCNPKSPSFFDVEVIKPLAASYSIDLDCLEPELTVAKQLIQSNGVQSVHKSLQLLAQMKDAFPIVLEVLQLAMTFPVTSASSERSFSALKKIKTCLRSKMHQERLCNLSILSIERSLSKSLNLEEVIDKFDELHPRRILLH